MTIPLPADPDGMNEQRSDWARVAALSFARQTGQDYRTDGWEEILSDLIADIHHLCDREGIGFDLVFRRAILHYQQEVEAPRPFKIVDMAPVPDFVPGQTTPIVEAAPTERGAWEILADLPDADTGRYRIVAEEAQE